MMYQVGKWGYIVAMCFGNSLLYTALGAKYSGWDFIWNWVCFQMIITSIEDGEGIKWKKFFGMFSAYVGLQIVWSVARPIILVGKSFEEAAITAAFGCVIIIPVYFIYSIGIAFFFRRHLPDRMCGDSQNQG